MKNYTYPVEEDLKYYEYAEDVHEYISNLFSTLDSKVLDFKTHPFIRLEELNFLKNKILKETEQKAFWDKNAINKAVELLETSYLKRILEDFLNVKLAHTEKENELETKAVHCVMDEIGFLEDSDFSRKIKNGFQYTYFDRSLNVEKKRNALINELFNGNLDKYLNVFKNKTVIASKILFKQLLLTGSQNLTNENLKKLILDLVKDIKEEFYLNEPLPVYENAKKLLLNSSLISLLSNGQKGFYEALKILRSKLTSQENPNVLKTNDDKNIMDFFEWLEKTREEGKQVITMLFDLIERKKNFALDKPNMITCQLKKLTEDLSGQNYEIYAEDHFNEINEICNKARNQAIKICEKILNEEKKYINKIKTEKRFLLLNKITKYCLVIFSVFSFVFVVRYGYHYFNDIDNIYKNDFYKNAKLGLETVSYPGELKDSLNPVVNETRQKQRLDYIYDLNNRYFKIITAYLDPDITDDVLKNALPLLSIPQDLKEIKKIKEARSILNKAFSADEWKSTIEPYIGPNVLTELRAYGAISNFLIPSLSHYVIKDSSRTHLYNPPLEKNILRKDLIQRFMTLPQEGDDNPSAYIDKYDENYKNIINVCKTLFKKIEQRKIELFNLYNKKDASVDKKKIKDVLMIVSILECRTEDLLNKVKDRHDYVINNNTYRAPLEE